MYSHRKACSRCIAAKMKCDQKRPCGRCTRRGEPEECLDIVRKKRVSTKHRSRNEIPLFVAPPELPKDPATHFKGKYPYLNTSGEANHDGHQHSPSTLQSTSTTTSLRPSSTFQPTSSSSPPLSHSTSPARPFPTSTSAPSSFYSTSSSPPVSRSTTSSRFRTSALCSSFYATPPSVSRLSSRNSPSHESSPPPTPSPASSSRFHESTPSPSFFSKPPMSHRLSPRKSPPHESKTSPVSPRFHTISSSPFYSSAPPTSHSLSPPKKSPSHESQVSSPSYFSAEPPGSRRLSPCESPPPDSSPLSPPSSYFPAPPASHTLPPRKNSYESQTSYFAVLPPASHSLSPRESPLRGSSTPSPSPSPPSSPSHPFSACKIPIVSSSAYTPPLPVASNCVFSPSLLHTIPPEIHSQVPRAVFSIASLYVLDANRDFAKMLDLGVTAQIIGRSIKIFLPSNAYPRFLGSMKYFCVQQIDQFQRLCVFENPKKVSKWVAMHIDVLELSFTMSILEIHDARPESIEDLMTDKKVPLSMQDTVLLR